MVQGNSHLQGFLRLSIQGIIPALITSLGDFLKISLSQLNHPGWRILIAIQNLGNLEHISVGINEILFAYYLTSLNSGEGWFHLFPQSGLPCRRAFQDKPQRTCFSEEMDRKYVLMSLPSPSYQWNLIGRRRSQLMDFFIYRLSHSLYVINAAGSHPIIPEGESTVLRAQRLPLEHHQVSYLVIEEVMTIKDTFGIHNEGGMVSYLGISEDISG